MSMKKKEKKKSTKRFIVIPIVPATNNKCGDKKGKCDMLDHSGFCYAFGSYINKKRLQKCIDHETEVEETDPFWNE